MGLLVLRCGRGPRTLPPSPPACPSDTRHFYFPVWLSVALYFPGRARQGGNAVSPFPVDCSLSVCPGSCGRLWWTCRGPHCPGSNLQSCPQAESLPCYLAGKSGPLTSYFSLKNVNSCSAHMPFDETLRERRRVKIAPIVTGVE